MLSLIYFYLIFINSIYGHGRITFPVPRLKVVDAGLNAPIYTCLGPSFGTTSTSMRCHDSPSSKTLVTYNSGDTIQLEIMMEAPHPGDCSIWLSYDLNFNSPQNWFKLKDFPGCFSLNGVNTFQGLKKIQIYLPEFLPSCEHCVLRWEWYSVQLVSNVEFYVNCIDIKIVNNFNNNCNNPGPTTVINGIEHLMYNLADPKQKGCPFYNVYDINIRPPIDKRSRGPKEWIPSCINNQNIPTVTPIPPIIYPCTNINCNLNGYCNNGKCICTNSYTGLNCEIQPLIQCNVNCKILNRFDCVINNICSNCKNGFIGTNTGNSLCSVSCLNNCTNLNRRSCIEPNICGVCLNGFTEPVSMNKNDKCIQNNVITTNGITLSITSQWGTGFCGKWITVCPLSREISFILPDSIRDIRAWNIVNMQKINNKMIGLCPTWSQTGQVTYGGLCGSFNIGQKVISTNNGFYFTTNTNMRKLYSTYDEMDSYYQNVSINMNVKTDSLYMADYDSLVHNLILNTYSSNIVLLDSISNQDTNSSDISIKVICNSRQEFDGALFVHMNKVENLIVDENLFFVDPISTLETQMNFSNKINFNLFLFLFIFVFINLN